MAQDQFKRKLTTIFSADVVGYSRLMGDDEAATVKTLEGHQSLPTSVATTLDETLARLDRSISLRDMSEFDRLLCPLIEEALQACPEEPDPSRTRERTGLAAWLRCLREAADRARQRIRSLETLARQSSELAAMDFTFLFDPARELFSIGFNVTEGRADASFYDLLASEARLCSYVAVALGQVSQDHWFSLARLLVAVRGDPVLVSWSGSIFEYLMPLLVMPTYAGTLLDETYQAVVARQVEYGRERAVPWGISASGYNETDALLNYQYQAFGVPGLGFKRGLGDETEVPGRIPQSVRLREGRSKGRGSEGERDNDKKKTCDPGCDCEPARDAGLQSIQLASCRNCIVFIPSRAHGA